MWTTSGLVAVGLLKLLNPSGPIADDHLGYQYDFNWLIKVGGNSGDLKLSDFDHNMY